MMDLTDQELMRYSRQILLTEVDVAGQLALKQSTVLIVGLGGLGAPVSLYLAAAGVGALYLADFDQVDESNLQRQIIHDSLGVGQSKVASAMQKLQALNPLVKLTGLTEVMDDDSLLNVISSVDVVVDCTDNFQTREAINKACVLAKKPLVSGAAIRLSGQVSVFDTREPNGPCYHCLYGAGEDEALTCSEAGVLGPLVGIVGSVQALETIKLLTNIGQGLSGRLLLLDALNTRFREVRVKKDPLCAVCSDG